MSKKEYLISDIDIRPLKSIFYQFVGLSLLNMILSNVENVILSFFLKNSNEEKSEYSFIVENFNIVTRLILRPMEDTFYNLINKLKNFENEENNNKKNKNQISTNNDLILNVLKLFIKFFSFFGILLISYYFLCGNDLIELVYSKKWATDITQKIGCSYAIYISIISINGIVECFANATNDATQMNLSYILLTTNSIFLVILNILISNWDICGLILANAISMVFRINGNLFIIFCGKKNDKEKNNIDLDDKKYKGNLYFDIKQFQKDCFLSNYSIVLTAFCVFFGKIIRQYIENKILLFKIGIYGVIGIINVFFIFLFEYKNVRNSIKKIKGT